MKKRVWLLGGYDAEMMTIKQILFNNNEEYIDHELNWGAKLSDYSAQLTLFPNSEIYGIELEEDILPPLNYYAIDHHGINTGKPASIIQVCNILGIKPSRYMELIAANDADYIPGMQKLGAKDTVIWQIRKLDRAYQGVTKEDEEACANEFTNYFEYNDPNRLASFHVKGTTKFSPLCDACFINNIHTYFVYGSKEYGGNGYEWNFYGTEEQVNILLDKLPKDGNIWSGKTFIGESGTTLVRCGGIYNMIYKLLGVE